MNDEDKTKEQLLSELTELRIRNAELESLEIERLQIAEHNKFVIKGFEDLNNGDGCYKGYLEMITEFNHHKNMEHELRKYYGHLENLVEARTRELNKANQELQKEISKRKHIEEKLEAERNRLFSVLDGLPAQVYLIDRDYTFHFSNRFFQERFGDPQGNPCYKLFHGRVSPCENCTTFKPGQPIEVQIGEFCYSDGYTYEVYDYPFIDVDGSELLLSFAIDITDRKQAEQALLKSEEKFFKAFNACPFMMTITNLKGGLIDVNKSFCNYINSSRKELLSRTLLDLGFWVDPNEYDEVIRIIMAKESARDMEIHFIGKKGEHRLGLYTAESLCINGELCILSIITDITDRKEMETEMIKLDRLNMVGEIAASLGHEIRNPMTTVRGFLQIMRENEDYFKERDSFDLMIEELDRANSIITEFLSLARSKLIELKQTNFNALIKNIYPLVQASAMVQDKYVKIEIGDIPDLLIDEKEIRQLILNLVCNGLESMSPGGSVTIKTFMEEDSVVLAIMDQGRGIDPEVLDKLGTPFFTTKEQGTGLGLAVCYGIATRHNAKIDIETSSTGTTFFIRFPEPETFRSTISTTEHI
ncbi:MAG: ATP-binding protein [Syntrophomonas sp.]